MCRPVSKQLAPGFGATIRGRHVMAPADLQTSRSQPRRRRDQRRDRAAVPTARVPAHARLRAPGDAGPRLVPGVGERPSRRRGARRVRLERGPGGGCPRPCAQGRDGHAREHVSGPRRKKKRHRRERRGRAAILGVPEPVLQGDRARRAGGGASDPPPRYPTAREQQTHATRNFGPPGGRAWSRTPSPRRAASAHRRDERHGHLIGVSLRVGS